MQTPADIRIPLALGLSLVLLHLLPVIFHPGSLALGSTCGLAPEQMWQMWSIGSSTSTHLGFPGPNLPTPLDAPLMAILFISLKSLFGGAIIAWNVAIAAGFVILLLGVMDLGHRLSPNAPMLARLTLVVAILGTPGWMPLVSHLGLAAVPMMAVPMALSTVDRWIQPTSNRWIGLIAGGLTLLACSGHWTTTVFVLAILIPLVVIQCRNIEGRQVWVKASWALIPGLIMGTTLVVLNAGPNNGIAIPPEQIGPTWIYQLEGALQLPATAVVSLPGLGILLLVLAGVAARPIQTVGWLLVAAWGILLAAGQGVDGFEALAPAHQLSNRIPALTHLGSWWGIAPLVSIPLGLTAMAGVEALHKVRKEKLAMAVLVVGLFDQVLPTLTTQTDQTFPLGPPAGVQTALSNLAAGAVLQLPSTTTDCTTHQLWQRAHGRPVSTPAKATPDGGLQISYLARLIAQQIETPGVEFNPENPIDSDTYLCASGDIGTLQDLGFEAVVLDTNAAPIPIVSTTLRFVLGEPIFEDGHALVWTISELESVTPTIPCPLPY